MQSSTRMATALKIPVASEQSGAENWRQFLQALRSEFGATIYNSWFAHLDFGGLAGETATLVAPTPFHKSWIEGRYTDTMLRLWQQIAAPTADFVLVDRAQFDGLVAPSVVPSEAPTNRVARPTGKVFNFADFVVGTSNRLAYSAARSVAEQTEPGFNPLYIYGGVGRGKTHLLRAIADAVGKQTPHCETLYLPAENFVYEFVRALHFKEMFAFKERLHAAEILLVDDIQFLQDKGHTQQDFLHMLERFLVSGRRVAIVGDRPPGQLKVDKRLASRLSGGLAVKIDAPDADLRRAFVHTLIERKRHRLADFDLDAAIIDQIVDRSVSGLRAVEGVFIHLAASYEFSGSRVTSATATATIDDNMLVSAQPALSIEAIQKRVAQQYDRSIEELISPRRIRSLVRPRQIAMYLAKVLTVSSLPEIGRHFGNRDHTTVLHAIRRVEGLMQGDPELTATIEGLRRDLTGGGDPP